jgi:hypothetical protein
VSDQYRRWELVREKVDVDRSVKKPVPADYEYPFVEHESHLDKAV